MCRAQPASPAIASALAMAATSAATGREAAKSAIAGAARRERAQAELAHDHRALGVHRDGQAEHRRPAHSLVQREVVAGGEVVDAAVGHERLEADDTAGGQLVHLLDAPRHEPAPEREVDVRRAARRGQLGLERACVDRRRVGVQRHVDSAREAAGRERARAAAPAFPGGAAGVVEVHVRVDQARQDVETARVDDLVRVVAEHARLLASRDHAVGHRQVGALGADDRVEGHAALLR